MQTDPIILELQKARIKLLLDWPIFGPIILHLELKEVDWCKTAATDGRYFYYSREFVKQLDVDQLVFLTAHEVTHCCLNHLFRRGNRDPARWNMAVDYAVNYLLMTTKDEHGQRIGREIKNVPPVDAILFDLAYSDDMSAEEIYALLEQNQCEIKMPLDMHLDGDGDGSEDQKSDSEGNCSGPPLLTEEEKNEIRDIIQTTLVQAAQQAVDPGSIPAGILRMLDRLMKPKIDWRQMLDNVLRSAIKHDYSYMRLSRRFWTTGYILPGPDVMEKVKAVAFIDGSGSTTKEMVTEFLSECLGITQTFQDFELIVGTFDTAVYNVVTYTPENVDEIYDYEFKGGGGTKPSCCWDYMEEHEIEPHKLLIFTDGHVGEDWGRPTYDTLFIVHSNPKAKASHGLTVYYP